MARTIQAHLAHLIDADVPLNEREEVCLGLLVGKDPTPRATSVELRFSHTVDTQVRRLRAGLNGLLHAQRQVVGQEEPGQAVREAAQPAHA